MQCLVFSIDHGVCFVSEPTAVNSIERRHPGLLAAEESHSDSESTSLQSLHDHLTSSTQSLPRPRSSISLIDLIDSSSAHAPPSSHAASSAEQLTAFSDGMPVCSTQRFDQISKNQWHCDPLWVKELCIALYGIPIAELRSVTCHMGSHSVTCHLAMVNVPHFNPSQTGQYSIYLPWRDGRLS